MRHRARTPTWPTLLALLLSLPASEVLAQDDGEPAAAPAPTATPALRPYWEETISGDWGGERQWLQQHGIQVAPRLTQFVQGLTAGDGELETLYGGKADLLISADLSKLGLWDGLFLVAHAEYNFGRSINGYGGVAIPVNSALDFPGMDGADAFDFSSVYFTQRFGDSTAVLFGKINMIDMAANRPFMGGAGYDSFWNLTFVAPPSGTVPPYLAGVLANVRTKSATWNLWIYDPVSVVNKSVFDDTFADGVTVRGSVEFRVTPGGLPGTQGFTALYSTQDGTDLTSLDDILLPSPEPGTIAIKDSRYYFAWSFTQTLWQSAQDGGRAMGLFGQLSASDGNPNGLHHSMLLGLGGKGLFPRRLRDNWGVGYYYDHFSSDLKEALASLKPLRDEQGLELFYNFALRPGFVLGLDLQVIRPALANPKAVFPGVRAVIDF